MILIAYQCGQISLAAIRRTVEGIESKMGLKVVAVQFYNACSQPLYVYNMNNLPDAEIEEVKRLISEGVHAE